MDKKQILDRLQIGISNYDEFLNNHEFLVFFVKNDEKYDYKKITFEKNNFKHLTGIENKLSSSKFYDNVKDKKLTHEDIGLKKDGTTRLKLDILDRMHYPFHSPSMIGEYFNGSKIYLDVNEVIGTSAISIGLKELYSKDYLIPASLLKENVKKITAPTFPVVFVLKKQKKEKHFNKIAYCKSDFCLKTFFNQNEKLLSELPINEELFNI